MEDVDDESSIRGVLTGEVEMLFLAVSCSLGG